MSSRQTGTSLLRLYRDKLSDARNLRDKRQRNVKVLTAAVAQAKLQLRQAKRRYRAEIAACSLMSESHEHLSMYGQWYQPMGSIQETSGFYGSTSMRELEAAESAKIEADKALKILTKQLRKAQYDLRQAEYDLRKIERLSRTRLN